MTVSQKHNIWISISNQVFSAQEFCPIICLDFKQRVVTVLGLVPSGGNLESVCISLGLVLFPLVQVKLINPVSLSCLLMVHALL